MTLSLVCPKINPKPWIRAFQHLDPGLEVRVWPDDHPRAQVEMALTWNHPPGKLAAYPSLGCISSMGAGVDHLLSDPDLPDGVPLVRLVDDRLVRDMAEYLLLALLRTYRRSEDYRRFQEKQDWHPLPPLEKDAFPVGIMGMGQLGRAAALKLVHEGFPVLGWKNSREQIPGIQTFHGLNQLPDFLSLTRVLVCLLPLTPATRHILNLDLFSRLAPEAYLINVGRGGHLNEPDLIAALDRGILSGACLDVFETEPLPPDHPFWIHPKIRITPHVSSQTHPASVAPQVLENLERLRSGRALINLVDREKGY